jgi:hypothetical protein
MVKCALLCEFSPLFSYWLLLPKVFRSQNNSDNRKHLIFVTRVKCALLTFNGIPENNFCSSSYLKWSINIICSKWKKKGTALHYTVIAHSVWIQRCLGEQYVYIVPYGPGVVLRLMDGSFFVSVYPRSDRWQQYIHKMNKLHTSYVWMYNIH